MTPAALPAVPEAGPPSEDSMPLEAAPLEPSKPPRAEVLLLSLAEINQLPLHMAPIDVNTFANHIYQLMHAICRTQHITLVLNCPQPTVDVIMDMGRMTRVFTNLIDNAIHASKEALNKKIEIEFAEQVDTISLCIRDHGPGFSAEVLDNLFNLYQTTRDNGTGIGLWLSREIIEKHKGKISAFNHAEGGACVLIELPIAGDSR